MERKKEAGQSGQSLIEVLIALAIGSLFIGAAVAVIVVALRISSQNAFAQKATELNQELADQVSIVAKDSWHNVDGLVLGSSTQYYLSEAGNFLEVNTGTDTVTIDGIDYTRWFSLEEVERDSNNQIVASSGTVDPSTFKVTLYTQWAQNADTGEIKMTRYIIRNSNEVMVQSDWASGGGVSGPVTDPENQFFDSTNIHYASSGKIIIADFEGVSASSTGNIDSVYRWAWNDVIGWIDFRFYENVAVSGADIQGYASSSVNEIALNCTTSPSTDCSYPYLVVNDENTGALSGWAWNENIGWISFNCLNTGACGLSNYSVTINLSTGIFSGWAWNDIVGWISFNCSNNDTCTTVDYKVKTSWGNSVIEAILTSSIIDTGVTGGATLNTIMWQGDQPAGTVVKFQIASSNNSSGPWNYMGPDGTDTSYYEPAGPDIQTQLSKDDHNNKRYFRYKVFLESNTAKTQGPTVNSIIISWAP